MQKLINITAHHKNIQANFIKFITLQYSMLQRYISQGVKYFKFCIDRKIMDQYMLHTNIMYM